MVQLKLLSIDQKIILGILCFDIFVVVCLPGSARVSMRVRKQNISFCRRFQIVRRMRCTYRCSVFIFVRFRATLDRFARSNEYAQGPTGSA
jgi:hypothetical protein